MRKTRGEVPDRIEERDGALDLGRGNRLVLDCGELVTQLSHSLLELAGALVELGQALGGHAAAAGFVATEGLQTAGWDPTRLGLLLPGGHALLPQLP
jgi:hypothetical protein